ncbi:MAG TPA: hypothetical protein VGC76_01735 [Pyrinomonadaceae bacterium]
MSENQKSISNNRTGRILRGALSFCFLALALFSSSAFAQKGTVVRKKVAFAKGTSSTTLKGSAAWGTAYVYTLQAKAGQRMTITLAGKPSFDFSLVVPPDADGEQPDGETHGVKNWSGTLNDSGVYQIIVSHTIDGVGAAPFTLKISIK